MLGHAPLSQFPLSALEQAALADATIRSHAADDAALAEAVQAFDGAVAAGLGEHAAAPFDDTIIDDAIAAAERGQAETFAPSDELHAEWVAGPPDQDEGEGAFLACHGFDGAVPDDGVEEHFAAAAPDETPLPPPVPVLGGGGVASHPPRRRAARQHESSWWPEPDPWRAPKRPRRQLQSPPRRRITRALKPDDLESRRELELLLAIALGFESED